MQKRGKFVVSGDSMLPDFSEGDIVSISKQWSQGDAVVAKHPYMDRLILKRAADICEGRVYLQSANQAGGTDSRHFGTVASYAIIGKASLSPMAPRAF